MPTPAYLRISDEVRAALAADQAVVALESTLLAHGLPWPQNLAVGSEAEATVRAAGAIPATVAVLGGKLCVGLLATELERVARGPLSKAAAADLGPLLASGGDGATTVSATVLAAARAGIRLFATGGIGGVHRGDALDVSSDLTTLASQPVAVVSAGAKAILDLPRTLEYLETLGVPVIGYRTDDFPGFYTPSTGLRLAHRVDSAAAAAALFAAHLAVHPHRGLLLVNPIPATEALEAGLVERAIDIALRSAASAGVTGKQLTPFLLARIAESTAQESLRSNRALVLHNVRVAAEIAVALVPHLLGAAGPRYSEAERDAR
jgi:pseudouridine-5'-phosphate glycosidase